MDLITTDQRLNNMDFSRGKKKYIKKSMGLVLD